jgi:hypothetical protein
MAYKCGSGISEWVVPDRPFWMWFKSIKHNCKKHDIDYEKGGTEADRLKSDLELGDGIEATYSTSLLWRFKSYRERAKLTADGYFKAVQWWGESSFSYQGDKDSLSLEHFKIGLINESKKRGYNEFNVDEGDNWEMYYNEYFNVKETVELYWLVYG